MMIVQAVDPYLGIALSLPAVEWEAVAGFVGSGAAPKLPAFVPANATPLMAQRAMATRYEALLTRLHETNMVGYIATRPLSPSDLAAIKRLGELADASAHVDFADGKRAEGVGLLMDALTLSLRTQAENAERDAFRAFVRERQSIPLDGCEQIRKLVDARWNEANTVDLRFRLQELRLRMRIEAYRWKFGKAPAGLAEAAPAVETLDPRSGRSFLYEPVGPDYRLGDEVGTKTSPIFIFELAPTIDDPVH